MFIQLFTHLKNIEQGYERSIEIADQIFDGIKANKINQLPELTKQQTVLMNELKQKKEELKKIISNTLENSNVKEIRLQYILNLFEQKQKEEIVDKQKDIVKLEEKLKRNLTRNRYFLGATLSRKEAKIDAIIELNERENKENNIFLNKKY